MDEVKGFEMVRLFCIILRAQDEHKGSCERQPGGSEVGVMRLEDQGRDNGPRNASSLQKQKHAGAVPFQSSQRSPPSHCEGKPRETDNKPRHTVINLLL